MRVVVTGGSRGLGLGIAKTLAYHNYEVIVLARTSPDAEKINFVRCDLSHTETFAELALTIKRKFGPIYGLVNNAGISLSGVHSMQSDQAIRDLMNLNVISPMLLAKHFVPQMYTARKGRVINMASIVAANGYPGIAAYSASKAALVGFTKSLAREIGPMGITVNAVAPGFVETDLVSKMTDKQREQIRRRSALQRMATVDDVANTVKFLLSEDAKNITGTVVTVDAGNTA